MNLYFGILLSCLSLLFGCRNPEQKGSKAIATNDSLRIEKLRVTVINDTVPLRWMNVKFRSFWVPSEEQFNTIDSLVMVAITEYNKVHATKRLKPEAYTNYYRQCLCFTTVSNDSIVYINAMCGVGKDPVYDSTGTLVGWRKNTDWQHHFIGIEDGGDCYFQITIDVGKRRYWDFSVNGVA